MSDKQSSNQRVKRHSFDYLNATVCPLLPTVPTADISSLEKESSASIYDLSQPLSALLLCGEATAQLNCAGCQCSAELQLRTSAAL